MLRRGWPAITALLALAAPATAQTGPCQGGQRWSAPVPGTATFGACDGGALVTFRCTAPDAPVRATLALDGTDPPDGDATATLSTGSASRFEVSMTPGRDARSLDFEAPEAAMQALAGASDATLSLPGTRIEMHLRGSMAAIRAMYANCAPDAGDAPIRTASPAPDPAPTDANTAERGGGPTRIPDPPLEDGTAPDEQVLAAFREAWTGGAPPEPDPDLPAPARCDALAGGPVAGFGTDGAVPFRHVARDARAACRAAMEADPDAPRHAFHAARAHLAAGDDAAAIPLIRRAARAGHAPAMNALAVALLRGRAEPRGAEVASDLLDRAAGQDYAPALVNQALLAMGERQIADYSRALDLASRAAELGDPVGATLMGDMAFNGYGRADDPVEAARWYRIGAGRGDPDALAALTDAYAGGNGPWQEYSQAAIEAGHRAQLIGQGLYNPGTFEPVRMADALAAPPVERQREGGLLYASDGRDSDGALYWLLMWQRRAGDDWGASAAELEPLFDALAGRYDCAGKELYKITEQRLGCAK